MIDLILFLSYILSVIGMMQFSLWLEEKTGIYAIIWFFLYIFVVAIVTKIYIS